MEPLITNEALLIIPKAKPLSALQLVKNNAAAVAAAAGAAAVAAAASSHTETTEVKCQKTDSIDLDSLYTKLRQSISMRRIERLGGQSVATWDGTRSLAIITKQDGKFETFGRQINYKLCLEYYEALYLLELGRLKLLHNDLVLSIEKAYLLLLGEPASPKYSQYLVYAYLTRAGYILTHHQNRVYGKNPTPTETDCIWAWLNNVVQKIAVPPNIRKTEMYGKVKKQVERIKTRIKEQIQTTETTETTEETEETEENSSGPAKRPRLDTEDQDLETSTESLSEQSYSYLDALLDDTNSRKFESVFHKFKIMNTKLLNEQCESDDKERNDALETRKLSFHFDLFLHNNGFKKNFSTPPVMRVIVLEANESFPNHIDISNTYHQLLHPTPILVVSVGNAKKIQAFLYFFT